MTAVTIDGTWIGAKFINGFQFTTDFVFEKQKSETNLSGKCCESQNGPQYWIMNAIIFTMHYCIIRLDILQWGQYLNFLQYPELKMQCPKEK